MRHVIVSATTEQRLRSFAIGEWSGRGIAPTGDGRFMIDIDDQVAERIDAERHDGEADDDVLTRLLDLSDELGE